jgi:hypothetical protein
LPLRARLLARADCRAEFSFSLDERIMPGHAALFEFAGAAFDVKPDLLVKLTIKALAA